MRLFLICLSMLLLPLLSALPKGETTPRLILVTGCGRSGTQYISKVLNQSGLNVTHEHGMGTDGCVSWLMAARVDWAPWGPLAKRYQFKHIFHQVRDPVKVIQSYYNTPPTTTWEWIAKSIPEIKESDSNLTKCTKYWYYWNLMAEAGAEWTYRIEEIDTVYPIMGRKLGLPFNPQTLERVSRKSNSKGRPNYPISWKVLEEQLDPVLYKKVRNLAGRYGYSLDK